MKERNIDSQKSGGREHLQAQFAELEVRVSARGPGVWPWYHIHSVHEMSVVDIEESPIYILFIR